MVPNFLNLVGKREFFCFFYFSTLESIKKINVSLMIPLRGKQKNDEDSARQVNRLEAVRINEVKK